LQRFSQWLSGLDVVQSPRLAQLTLQNLRTRIHHAALERLAKMYERLCEEVKKPENKYEAGSTLLGSERPFGQVRLLWQIFGLQE
jgi:conserved oligomeric Golgi complex subunit 6